ncbi:DivIVA domain protein [Segniliparus rotundus DSM 44985]|uniref:Cell wall synthesis protein Wag31 n=1 Tax=Segniliparus rotundus (strain ATCC BAA-972 / CDC 1076 / CIP 108378 / DSM 44985 / JCM 13578) TaxID=640132 RepID=D6ZC30_SEGRD|nr:DivIVA domain-containing protein [Segniliparus rotundus]ADG98999.1 DivIVA domain protein [Segniliparus rotundus DSM 44985]
MQLTPADVHNVAFTRPAFPQRGYSEEEVDTFLDLVEVTLAANVEENTALKARVSELESQVEALQSQGGGAQAASFVGPADDQSAPGELANQAGRVLVRAQETADQILAEAKAERDRVLAEAKAERERLLSEANEKHEQLVAQASQTAESIVGEGRAKHEALLSEAQSQAEAKLRQANEHAQNLRAEAERAHAEQIGQISQLKNSLEGRVDELRTFEKDYRSRLRDHLQSMLTDLGSRSGSDQESNYPQQHQPQQNG